MHAVIAIFTTDQEQQERDLAFLRERIVPAVSREPGFVAGYRTNDGEHSYNMIIFDSREAAEARAAGVRGNAAGQAVAGHHRHSDHHRRGAGERPGGHRVNAGKSNPGRRVAVDRIADARPPRG